MGKLYDSLKQRGGSSGLPAASSMAPAPPRLQVIPAATELPAVDDHEPMPSYEVPNQDATLAAPFLFSSSPFVEKERARKGEKEKRREVESARIVTPKTKLVFAPHADLNRIPDQGVAAQVVVVHEPTSARAAEYREMAEHLIRLLTAQQARSLTLLPLEPLVINDLTRVGMSPAILAANIGCAWADLTKHPLVLVDAARSAPDAGISALLGLGSAPGWEEMMTGTHAAQTIQQTGRAWLDVIAAGKRLAFTGAGAWAKKTGSILHMLSKHYKSIILLAPTYPHSPLGLVLAETTDSTCVLVPADQVNHPQKDTLLRALAHQAGHVVGTIVMDYFR